MTALQRISTLEHDIKIKDWRIKKDAEEIAALKAKIKLLDDDREARNVIDEREQGELQAEIDRLKAQEKPVEVAVDEFTNEIMHYRQFIYGAYISPAEYILKKYPNGLKIIEGDK